MSTKSILSNSPLATAEVVAVRESLVTIAVTNQAIRKNEVGYVCVGQERLMAEVLRIQGQEADMQVFEDTRGVRVGDRVELTGEMLSVGLGPGLLGQVFDGLQKPLAVIAREHGYFLPRGVKAAPLNTEKKWNFTPVVKPGDQVVAGQVIGTLPEGGFTLKIMMPFNLTTTVEITRILSGSFTVNQSVAFDSRKSRC